MTTDTIVDGSRPPPHLLVFPFPAQGHLIPLLDLCADLAARFAFSITVVVTPSNLHLLSPFISSTQIQPLVLSLPPSSSLPYGVEHVRDLPDGVSIAALISALASLRPSLLLWAQSQPHPPSAILSDFFLGWCLDLAADLHIPHFAFFSSGALLAALLHPLLLSLPSPPSSPTTLLSVSPSLPSFPFHHLPSIFRRHISGNPDWEVTRLSLLSNSSSSAAVFNTFEFLEFPYLTHLRSTGYASGRILAVGPIPSAVCTSTEGHLIPWLDSCPAHSVVYVCFGSQFTPEPAVAAVLAAALEMTDARFVWVFGKRTVALPKGFEERTRGRGLVVRGWVSQRAALGHVAVAAFVTHCGWNSVLEGLTAGLLLLAWPMEADQFVNTRLLVEEAGVALRVCAGGLPNVPDEAALGGLMTESVITGTWPEVRTRVFEMGRRIRESVAEGGSSFRDMEELGKLLTTDR